MGENVTRPGRDARLKSEKPKSASPEKRKPLIKKGAVRLPNVSLDCFASMPSASNTDFWNEFIVPLKEAMEIRPRTFKELKEIVATIPGLPKSKLSSFHLNALSYMNLKRITMYSSETKLWRIRGKVNDQIREEPTERSVETLL